jgi:hypothetical protein
MCFETDGEELEEEENLDEMEDEEEEDEEEDTLTYEDEEFMNNMVDEPGNCLLILKLELAVINK